MACYAAVLSLYHTLNHIKNHPRPPISLDQQQLHSLTQNITFLQDFLERFPSYEDDDLESHIASAAYAAEDVIDTHIVNRIHHAGSASDYGENISSVDLYGGLERVIQDMDLIKTKVMQIIQDKIKIMRPQHHPHLHTNSSLPTASGVPAASKWQSSTMPVYDDAVIYQVLDKLTGQQTSLQIISIVGMGGIGKTTFATSLYTNPLIVQYFDTLAWVTISQGYSRGNILLVLCQEVKGSINGLSEMSEDEIGLILYQHLCGRRYLIVMDDIWSVDAWDKIKTFFPDNNDGSRIMITTRLSNMAFQLSNCYVFQMQYLDGAKCWDLLCKIVFGKVDCPIELENIGKEIARKCRGLPLSIAVVGGLLKKSNMTQEYWIYTLENLTLLINFEEDEYTLRILRTSYNELPMHLKPCFLYMGILPEDENLKMSMLIKLWVAEGILRPIDDKSLEEVGKQYLKELIDRNLILITKHMDGKERSCGIHDLLRDVCLREAEKQKFFCVLKQQKDYTPQDINMERRICIIPENTGVKYSPQFLHAMESASLVRSLLYQMHASADREKASPSLRFRLLRVFSTFYGNERFVADANNAIFEQANLRYLSLNLDLEHTTPRIRSLCPLLWNLQTLVVAITNYSKPIILSEIWEMPLLRHVKLTEFVLPDPPNEEHGFVLEYLQTLSCLFNLKFSEELVKRIPNVKKLEVVYRVVEEKQVANLCLDNLGRLQKLESLYLEANCSCEYYKEIIGRNLVSFPHSLKKLSLYGTRLRWEDFTMRIGSLPLLQVIKLYSEACVGRRWRTFEGQFCSLRILEIYSSEELKYWKTDGAHFPRLEHLFLKDFQELKEIPSSIGYIPTLKSIRLDYCCKSAADSARRIKEEQEEYGNEDLQVSVDFCEDSDDDDYNLNAAVLSAFFRY